MRFNTSAAIDILQGLKLIRKYCAILLYLSALLYRMLTDEANNALLIPRRAPIKSRRALSRIDTQLRCGFKTKLPRECRRVELEN